MTRPCLGATAAICLLVAVTPAAGARERPPSLRDVRRAMESPPSSCRLEVDEELRFGRTKLWLARMVVRMVEDVDPEAEAILDGLRRVEVGSYRVRGDATSCPISARLESELLESGWNRAVSLREGNDDSMVLHHLDSGGGINAMLVVTVEGRSVEIVHLEGRIGDVLAIAIAEEPDRAASVVPTR